MSWNVLGWRGLSVGVFGCLGLSGDVLGRAFRLDETLILRSLQCPVLGSLLEPLSGPSWAPLGIPLGALLGLAWGLQGPKNLRKTMIRENQKP